MRVSAMRDSAILVGRPYLHAFRRELHISIEITMQKLDGYSL